MEQELLALPEHPSSLSFILYKITLGTRKALVNKLKSRAKKIYRSS
jgi:hypothetical protein